MGCYSKVDFARLEHEFGKTQIKKKRMVKIKLRAQKLYLQLFDSIFESSIDFKFVVNVEHIVEVEVCKHKLTLTPSERGNYFCHHYSLVN